MGTQQHDEQRQEHQGERSRRRQRRTKPANSSDAKQARTPGQGEDLDAEFRDDQHLPQDPEAAPDEQALVGESETSVRRSGTRGEPHGRQGPHEAFEDDPVIDPDLSELQRRSLEDGTHGPAHREPAAQHEPGEAAGGTGETEELPAERPGTELDEDEVEVRTALEPPDLDELADDATDDESMRKPPSELTSPRRGGG